MLKTQLNKMPSNVIASEAKQSQWIAELVPSGARNLRVCFGCPSQPLSLLAMTAFFEEMLHLFRLPAAGRDFDIRISNFILY